MTRQNGDWKKLTDFLKALDEAIIEVTITDKGLAAITGSKDKRQNHPEWFSIEDGDDNSIRQRAEDAKFEATYDLFNKRVKHFTRLGVADPKQPL